MVEWHHLLCPGAKPAMKLRTYSALLLLAAACATTEPPKHTPTDYNLRIANLQQAARLPWLDGGRCVVQEASHPWPVVVERCFHALDNQRIRFRDVERRCPIASADAATLETMVGICLLAQPELVVGAVVIIGVVVVGAAIAEELEEHSRSWQAHPEDEASSEAERAGPRRQPSPEEPLANGEPTPRGLGRDWFTPGPPESPEPRERRPECVPQRVPPKGGHPWHNECADAIPGNSFRGFNALVNGKAFDALQPVTRILWEVKTDNFDTYPPDLQDIVVRKQVRDMRRDRDLARACGFDFRIGVRKSEHKAALEREARDLQGLIVVMDWCRDDSSTSE